MRHILRLHDTVPDAWRYPDEPGNTPLILPLAEVRTLRDSGNPLPAQLGVQVGAADALEDVVPLLAHVQLVAVQFPSPGEGRGFSIGKLLRQRYHHTGELRARGAGVKQDKIFLLARCGFDAFELGEGENEEEARRALHRYSVAYQDGDAAVSARRRLIA